ncbi:MAG: acyl-CoA dehydrogenase family protein [Pseudomonadota bacterium]
MDQSDDILAMLRDAAGDFIGGRFDAAGLQRDPLEPRAVDRALWTEMADMGWLAVALPEEAGGSGLGLVGVTALAELFGRTQFPAPFVACAAMPSVLLAQAPAPAGAALTPLLHGGERLMTLAWQEQAGQIELGTPATRLQRGTVTGRKLFVPGVQADSVLLVYASRDGVPALVAVAADGPGVIVELAAAGSGTYASVNFEQAPVLNETVLLAGEVATGALQAALSAGRIALSAQLAGLAAGCLEKTIAYVGDRVQFGQPIGTFQAIQHRCVDLHIDVLLAGASWRHALAAFTENPALASTQAAVSAAKARCGEVAVKVARQAVQMHGAMGFAEESGVGSYLRAALQGASHLGGPDQHRRRFVQFQSIKEQVHG